MKMTQVHIVLLGRRKSFSDMDSAFRWLRWRAAVVWFLRDLFAK